MKEEHSISLDLTKGKEWSRIKAVRITSKNKRVYRLDSGEYCLGVSSWMDELMPYKKKKHLTIWREGLIEQLGSASLVDAYVNMTAQYGTAYGEICVKVGMAIQEKKIQRYADINKIIETHVYSSFPINFANLILEDMKKDVSCFIEWVNECEVEFFAFECMVASKKYGLCTPIDVVCMAKLTPKGEKQLCSINIKSGRGQGTEMHRDQLELEYFAFVETYGIEPNMCIFAPKDYTYKKGAITYNFEVLKNINHELLKNTMERSKLIGMKQMTGFSVLHWNDNDVFDGRYLPVILNLGENG